MTPLSIVMRLTNAVRRLTHTAQDDAWDGLVRGLDDAPSTVQYDSTAPDATQDANDPFDDRRVPRDPHAEQSPRLRIVKGMISQAAATLVVDLTLDQAVDVIRALPSTASNLVNLDIQQRAFACIRQHFDEEYSCRDHDRFAAILSLLARRLGDLANPDQRDQAMTMIEQSQSMLPQIGLVETLAQQLGQIPSVLHQRTLDLIEQFLSETADVPLSHIDILLGLTRAVPIAGCRQRAGVLVAAGLKRLRHEPRLCAQIRHSLVFAYCTVEQGLQLQA